MHRSIEPAKVIHNHLGFRPGHRQKKIIVPCTPAARYIFGSPIFTVIEQNELSKYALMDERQNQNVFRASMEVVHDDFGKWFVGDFSEITTPGVYQAFCGNEPGVPFVVHDGVWSRVLPLLLSYMKIQSCGRDVPGWHDACHLDDGYIHETDTHMNASGGWHDAGDFRKWATSTSLNAISLLLCHRLWAGRENSLGLEPGVFLREARQGLPYFLNVQDAETGGVYHNVGGGAVNGHDNLDCRYTDNIPRSGDERRIHPGFAVPPAKMTVLFALYASILKDSDRQLADRCLAAASKSVQYDRKTGKDDADSLQWRAWGFLEIWRYSDEAAHRDAACGALAALLDLQVTEPAEENDGLCGYFHSSSDKCSFLAKGTGAYYLVWVLSEFITALPDHPDADRWRRAIELWADGFSTKFAARNVFGLTPFSLYAQPPAEHPDHTYRAQGDRLWFRYFCAGHDGMTNARLSLAAVGFAAAARSLERADLADYGYRLIEWISGANPFQISMVVGLGPKQMAPFSPQVGPVPGGVMNGIGGDAEDQPALDYHPWALPPEVGEFYGYNTSQFLWAVCALQA